MVCRTSALSASSAAISSMIASGLRCVTSSPPLGFFTDKSNIVGSQRVLFDWAAVHKRARGAVRILNDNRSAIDLQAAMRARHARIVQPDITRLPASDGQHLAGDQFHAQSLIWPFDDLQVLIH